MVDTKDWDPTLYDRRHSFVWEHGRDLLELLAPRPGERIIDLGCGTGHLTAAIARAGADVLGLDASRAMIDEARRLHPKLPFKVADARSFRVPEPVDAVFSNAALHWVTQPKRAAEAIARALRPGGRFVAELGGQGNISAIIAAMQRGLGKLGRAFPNEAYAWYFPSIADYAQVLERAGLEVTFAVLFDRPTPLEGADGLRNWLTMFAEPFLRHVPPELMERFLAGTEAAARPKLYGDGRWIADYRRLRIVARKPEE